VLGRHVFVAERFCFGLCLLQCLAKPRADHCIRAELELWRAVNKGVGLAHYQVGIDLETLEYLWDNAICLSRQCPEQSFWLELGKFVFDCCLLASDNSFASLFGELLIGCHEACPPCWTCESHRAPGLKRKCSVPTCPDWIVSTGENLDLLPLRPDLGFIDKSEPTQEIVDLANLFSWR
jgi:hypothetical protein